jgi:hypothetical protein
MVLKLIRLFLFNDEFEIDEGVTSLKVFVLVFSRPLYFRPNFLFFSEELMR